MVQTVVKEQYKSESLTFRNDLFETEMTFEVYGQTVDRSYEDRDVHFSFPSGGWLKGEDAIALGQLLVKHGTNALMANMINHQHILEMTRLKQWIDEGIIEKIIMTVVDEKPANHGSGFRTYEVKPVFKEGKAPEYYDTFTVETVKYWSPFKEEYEKQIAWYGGNVEFVGYDREKELREFDESCRRFNEECADSVEGEVPAVQGE